MGTDVEAAPVILESTLYCTRSGSSRGRKLHLTRSLVAFGDGHQSGTIHTENTVGHTKSGRIRGWSLMRVVVLQGLYCSDNVQTVFVISYSAFVKQYTFDVDI